MLDKYMCVCVYTHTHTHTHTLLSQHCTKPCAEGFPDGAVVKNLPANAGDTGSSPGLGRSHMPWSN